MTRFPDRLQYDFETIAAIVDEALYSHIGVTTPRGPMVIPTIAARRSHTVYVHGSVLADWVKAASNFRVCLTSTIIDDLVLARSAFNHSMNYRSVVIAGQALAVVDVDEKTAALKAIVERMCPGRWDNVRKPTAGEIRTTKVLSISLNDAVAKVRNGPGVDFEHDLKTNYWAGRIPISLVRGDAVPDPGLPTSIPIPPHVTSPFNRAFDRTQS